MRAEGVNEEDYSDEQLENSIADSCDFIDRVTGQWGYVDEDGFTPSAIKRAAMKLVLYYFHALTDFEAQEENAIGLLLSETTDGHT